MPHPNGRRPINPQEFSPHTAKQRAAKYAAKEARRQRRAARRAQRPRNSGAALRKVKIFLMVLPLLMALYVLVGLWTD